MDTGGTTVRESLVATCEPRWRALRSRRAGFALALCGPPGIGKSVLAAELVARGGVSHVRVRANAPLSELARAWRALPRVPTWVQRVLEQLEAGEWLGAAAVSRALLMALTTHAPVVVLLEDLHECQAERLRLWTQLVQGVVASRGVAVLATSRAQAPDGFESHWLQPFSGTELRVVLDQDAGVALPDAVLTWLWARSAGNPLLALEFLRDARRNGQLWLDGAEWRWREPAGAHLPSTVEALIERVLDGLGADATEALAARTMLEDGDAPSLWEPLSQLPTGRFAAARSELERVGVLRAGVFTHQVFLQVAQSRVAASARQVLAVRLIEALEGQHPARAVALLPLTGWHGERALGVLERAAQMAEGRSAARFRALAVLHLPREQRVQAALQAVDALAGADLALADQVLAAALEVDPTHLELCSLRARNWVRLGQPERARPLLEGLPQRDAAWWLEWMKLLVNLGEHAAGLAIWDERPDIQGLTQPAWAASMIGLLSYQGRFDDALRLADQVLALPGIPAGQLANVHNSLGVVHQSRGAFELALASYQLSFTLAEQGGRANIARLAVGNMALVLQALGRYQDAEDRFAESARWHLDAGDVLGYAGTQASRGANASNQGRFADAERLLLEAHSILSRGEPSFELIECETFLARLYTLWGLPLHEPLALRHANAALRHARTLGGMLIMTTALECAIFVESRLGDAERALTLLEEREALSNFNAADADAYRGAALERLGQRNAALAALERATQGLQQTAALNAQLVGLEWDRLRGDRASAEQRAAWFAAHGQGLGVHLVRRYFPPAASAASNPVWQVNILGPFALERDGQAVRIKGEKRKSLLALLLESRLAGQLELRQADLMLALYPHMGEDDARAALKQLVFQVRDTLDASLIRTTENGYGIGEVQSDVQRFLETGDTSLWRGAYLADLTGTHELGLEVVRDGLTEHLRNAGFAALHHDAHEAVRVSRLLLEMDPYDGAALELGLRAYRSLGQYAAVRRLYDKSRERWLEVGERLPDRWTAFVPVAA